jgi:uncharacterized membrane protein
MKRLALPLLAAYPLLVWFALTHWSARAVALLTLGILALRFAATREAFRAAAEARAPLAAAALLCVAAALLDWRPLLLAVPVVMSAFLAFVFGRSLATVPLVERFAALEHPDLMGELAGYCRHVTQLWFGFLLANAALCLVLALFAPLEVWALYTGFGCYVLMGVLFAAEWLVRQGRLRAARLAVHARAETALEAR